MADSGFRSEADMDLFPWPEGLGFENADGWWRYVLEQSEPDRLELLMSAALLVREIELRVLKHDPALFALFGFSDEILTILGGIEAGTLGEFAEAVLLKRSGNQQ